MISGENWQIYTLLSLFLYGLWGFLSKFATNYIDPKTTLIYDIAGSILVALVLVFTNNFRWQGDVRGISYAVLIGIAGAVATLCFLVAVSKSSTAIVLGITSLYPVVTIILGFLILKEPISLRQGMGILLAVGALMLLSGGESK
jgi:bacterial/archaeal transporter family protein